MGLAMRRARARRGPLALAAATVLLATTLVVATALLLQATARSSVGAALASGDPAERLVTVTAEADVLAEDATETDETVADALAADLAPAGVEVDRRVLSSSYALPGPRPGAPPSETELALVGVAPGLADHAALVAGEWPAESWDGAGVGDTSLPVPLPTALHERAAARLGLAPGDRVRLVNRLDDSVLDLVVVALFRPTGPGSAYWAGDTLGLTGIERGTSFTTFGPFLAAEGAQRALSGATVTWRADPQLAGLGPDQVAVVRAGADRLLADGGTRLSEQLDLPVEVDSDLDGVLGTAAVPLAVASSAVAVPAALVVLLALAALLLVARVVQEDRAAAAALQGSRGFSVLQLRRGNAVEAVLVVLPGLALGPLLAWALVDVVARWSDAAPTVAALSLRPAAWAWAAVFCSVVALVLTRRGVARGEVAGGSRTGPLGAWTRLGLDLVPVPLAVVALLRLRGYGEPGAVPGEEVVLASGSGADPVLVLTPLLLVLAAALLLGRVLPAALGLLAAPTSRRRGAVTALTGWALARRPSEHRPMLVAGVLVGAVGVLAAAQLTSYSASQDDQAALAVGADVRVAGVVADRADAVVEAVTGAAPGARAVVVNRERLLLGDRPVEVLAVDAGAAGAVMDPLRDEPWTSGLAPLVPDPAPGDPVPAVASRDVADQAGPAGRLRVRVAGVDLVVQVAAEVPLVPGVGPDAQRVAGDLGAPPVGTGSGLVLDRAAVAERVPDLASGTATEVWAAVPDVGSAAAVREAVAATDPAATVADRWSVGAAGRDGPVGAGLRVAVRATLVAALAFGVVGFVAAAGSGLRRRRAELASLRAVGLSGSQVGRSLLAERLGVLTTGLVAGLAVGTVTAWLVLPRLVLTERGTTPLPPPAPLAVPWPLLLLALLLVLVVCALAFRATVARAVGRPLGAELRAGEDT